MFLGEIIKQYRIAHNMTMQDFADASGLSKSYISIIEKNRNPQNQRNLIPSLDTFQKAAHAMHISVDELVRMTDDNQKISLSHEPNLDGLTNVSFPSGKWLPILGNICAGDGIFCEENFDGVFYVDDSIKADLCVRVHGDSMIDAGIYDSDMVFIKKEYDYEDGRIYAVRINANCEAVLKKVTLKDDIIVLAPCNVAADYQAIIERSDNVSIIGECVGVYHSTI